MNVLERVFLDTLLAPVRAERERAARAVAEMAVRCGRGGYPITVAEAQAAIRDVTLGQEPRTDEVPAEEAYAQALARAHDAATALGVVAMAVGDTTRTAYDEPPMGGIRSMDLGDMRPVFAMLNKSFTNEHAYPGQPLADALLPRLRELLDARARIAALSPSPAVSNWKGGACVGPVTAMRDRCAELAAEHSDADGDEPSKIAHRIRALPVAP
jgi:hypothetical protein